MNLLLQHNQFLKQVFPTPALVTYSKNINKLKFTINKNNTIRQHVIGGEINDDDISGNNQNIISDNINEEFNLKYIPNDNSINILDDNSEGNDDDFELKYIPNDNAVYIFGLGKDNSFNKITKSKDKNIIHISGPSGSGKSFLGNKLLEIYDDKILVKDTDVLLRQFINENIDTSKSWTWVPKNYQEYIDKFIKDNSDKIIVFVGLNTMPWWDPDLYYNLHSNYNYYIKLDDDSIFKQKCNRFIDDIFNVKKENLIKEFMKNEDQLINELANAFKEECGYIGILQQNKKWNKDYKKQKYKILSQNDILTEVKELLNNMLPNVNKTSTKNIDFQKKKATNYNIVEISYIDYNNKLDKLIKDIKIPVIQKDNLTDKELAKLKIKNDPVIILGKNYSFKDNKFNIKDYDVNYKIFIKDDNNNYDDIFIKENTYLNSQLKKVNYFNKDERKKTMTYNDNYRKKYVASKIQELENYYKNKNYDIVTIQKLPKILKSINLDNTILGGGKPNQDLVIYENVIKLSDKLESYYNEFWNNVYYNDAYAFYKIAIEYYKDVYKNNFYYYYRQVNQKLYKGSCQYINKKEREIFKDDMTKLNKKIDADDLCTLSVQIINNIDKLFLTCPRIPFDMIIYRSETRPKSDPLNKIKVGQFYNNLGYMSTSINPWNWTPEVLMDNGLINIQMILHIPQDSYGYYIRTPWYIHKNEYIDKNMGTHEWEILLARSSIFEIVKKYDYKNLIIIEMVLRYQIDTTKDIITEDNQYLDDSIIENISNIKLTNYNKCKDMKYKPDNIKPRIMENVSKNKYSKDKDILMSLPWLDTKYIKKLYNSDTKPKFNKKYFVDKNWYDKFYTKFISLKNKVKSKNECYINCKQFIYNPIFKSLLEDNIIKFKKPFYISFDINMINHHDSNLICTDTDKYLQNNIIDEEYPYLMYLKYNGNFEYFKISDNNYITFTIEKIKINKRNKIYITDTKYYYIIDCS